MAGSTDDTNFYPRADAVINLVNEQARTAPADRAVMSATFAAARLNAWMCANMCGTGDEMAGRRAEAERIFGDEFRKMFLEHYDDYIANFDAYRKMAQGRPD